MPTENERRVQDLATAGKSLLDEWTARLAGVASRLDNDTLTVDDMVKTWAAGTRLAIKGWALTYSMLADPFGGRYPASNPMVEMAVSEFFEVPVAARQGVSLMLNLAGPLVPDVGGHQIPAAEVELKPQELGATETQFRFQFAKGSHPSLIYRGRVELRTAMSAPPLATVPVSIAVT